MADPAQRPLGRARRDRSARRRRPGDGRRQQLPQEPVQPRRQGVRQPGSAFKPFVLATALRQGISPATRFESEPIAIDLGDRFWAPANYNDGVPRLGQPREGDDRVGQLGVRAADPARRLEEGRRDRPAWGSEQAARRPLDRARHRGGEPRSSSRARTRRSPAAAVVWTGRSSATGRA